MTLNHSPIGLKMRADFNVDLDGAACRPWTGSHDSRHPRETNAEFADRLAAARAICGRCPVLSACRTNRDRYLAHRVRLDGIFAGRHYRYGGDAA